MNLGLSRTELILLVLHDQKNLARRKVEGQIQPGETKHETIRTVARDELEWTCQSKARVFRSHSMTEFLAEVFVKAVGSVTRETQKVLLLLPGWRTLSPLIVKLISTGFVVVHL